MKDCLLATLSVLHLVLRFIFFFVLPSVIYRMVTNQVAIINTNKQLYQLNLYTASTDWVLAQIVITSTWTVLTTFILVPLQIFIMAQHESLVGFMFDNMCGTEQNSSRTLCFCCMKLYHTVTSTFEGVATKNKNEPGSLRKRRWAALLMLLLLVNQASIMFYSKLVLEPTVDNCLTQFEKKNNDVRMSITGDDNKQSSSQEIDKLTEELTIQSQNSSVLTSMLMIDGLIALFMTLTLVINTAIYSSYVKDTINRVQGEENRQQLNDRGQNGLNHMNLGGDNLAELDGNLQDFKYTTVYQVDTVDMLVFIEARTFGSLEEAIRVISQEKESLKESNQNAQSSSQSAAVSNQQVNDQDPANVTYIEQLKCVYCQYRFKKTKTQNDDNTQSMEGSPSSTLDNAMIREAASMDKNQNNKNERMLTESEREEPKIIGLHCGHVFHRQCVQDWLFKRGTCPTCRQFVYQRDKKQQYSQSCVSRDNRHSSKADDLKNGPKVD